MGAKRRTSVLLDEALLRKARKVLHASSNTEAIARALEDALLNKEVEVSLRDLLRDGRGRFVDVYRQHHVPVLLDTSVYLFALRSAAGAALFERLFRPIIFRTHLSSVVVEELYAHVGLPL